MAWSKTSKRLKLRCQFCNVVNHTKNLKMEHVCKNCKKYAKYRNQKLKKISVYDTSHKMVIDVWQAMKPSKPCTVCGTLTPLDKTCCILNQEIAN